MLRHVALAREQVGRHRELAQLREAAADVLDVLVDAEDLVHDERRSAACPCAWRRPRDRPGWSRRPFAVGIWMSPGVQAVGAGRDRRRRHRTHRQREPAPTVPAIISRRDSWSAAMGRQFNHASVAMAYPCCRGREPGNHPDAEPAPAPRSARRRCPRRASGMPRSESGRCRAGTVTARATANACSIATTARCIRGRASSLASRTGRSSSITATAPSPAKASTSRGRVDGLVTAYVSDDPAGERLRSCCVPPGAARLCERYREGDFLVEVFYDRQGRAILSDGRLCPARPEGLPELAQFDESRGGWTQRSRELDRFWSENGMLTEENCTAAMARGSCVASTRAARCGRRPASPPTTGWTARSCGAFPRRSLAPTPTRASARNAARTRAGSPSGSGAFSTVTDRSCARVDRGVAFRGDGEGASDAQNEGGRRR